MSNSGQLSTNFYPILVSCQHTFIQFWTVVNTALSNSGQLSTHIFIQFWSVVNTLSSNSGQLSTHFYPILVSCQHTFSSNSGQLSTQPYPILVSCQHTLNQFWSVVNTLLSNSGQLSAHFYPILVSCQHTFIQFWSVVNTLFFKCHPTTDNVVSSFPLFQGMHVWETYRHSDIFTLVLVLSKNDGNIFIFLSEKWKL